MHNGFKLGHSNANWILDGGSEIIKAENTGRKLHNSNYFSLGYRPEEYPNSTSKWSQLLSFFCSSLVQHSRVLHRISSWNQTLCLLMRGARTLQHYVTTTSTFVPMRLRKTGGYSRIAVKHATNVVTIKMKFLLMRRARTLQRYVSTTSTFVPIRLRKTGGCSRIAVKLATNVEWRFESTSAFHFFTSSIYNVVKCLE